MRLRGSLDDADRHVVRGWVLDEDAPDQPVSLIVTAGDTVLARVLANGFRPDLEAAGIGNGRHSFLVDVSGLLSPLTSHLVSVRAEKDGSHLPGSPVLVEPSGTFGEARAAFGRSVVDFDTDAELEDRLAFLASQTQAVLRRADERRHGRAEDEARRRRRWLNPGAPEPTSTRARRALVIDSRSPAEGRDAGSLALLSHVWSLQRLGFAVSFVPADLGPASPLLESRGVSCLTRPWYASVEEVLARNGGEFEVVYLHRAGIGSVYGALVRLHQPKARLVFSVADLASLRLSRQAEVQNMPDLLAMSRSEAVKERLACFVSDTVVTHSTVEAGLLQRICGPGRVHVVPFSAPAEPVTRGFAERRGVGFIGSFDHRPNIDAAIRLVDEVVPALAALGPPIPCLIAGSGMTAALRTHLSHSDGAGPTVSVLGAVPDIHEFFDGLRLTCAPLAYGAGVKGKVLQSLAAGLPCACTTVAAEGLDLSAELRTLVADDAGGLATAIHRLHEDEALNASCAEAGRRFVADWASHAAIDAALARALG